MDDRSEKQKNMVGSVNPIFGQLILGVAFAQTGTIVQKKKKKKYLVFEKDNYTCCFCGSKLQLTIDHIVPKSKGGTNAIENLQTLCNSCNNKKGDTLLIN